MRPEQRYMTHVIWILLGALIAVDVYQNCMLGSDCLRLQDGTVVAWAASFVQWIMYSVPAFLLFAWILMTIFYAVRDKIKD